MRNGASVPAEQPVNQTFQHLDGVSIGQAPLRLRATALLELLAAAASRSQSACAKRPGVLIVTV